jgi:hypothetical protein
MKLFSKFSAALALAAALISPAAMATASPSLSFSGGVNSSLLNVQGTFNPVLFGGLSAYSSYDLTHMQKGGLLSLSSVANLTFTFEGKEASYNNAFTAFKTNPLAGGVFTNNGTAAGSSFSLNNVQAGALNFFFNSDLGFNYFGNGSKAVGLVLANDHKSALLLFNDKAGDKDYDDMVVKVSIMAAVPEPETYAMMLGGLALLGVAARRRKNRV